MLYEIPDTRQVSGEPRRRWFFSHDQDLYVWQDDSGEIVGFQLCYAKSIDEHAIYWRNDRGFSHMRVESKRRGGTPILMVDGFFDKDAVLERFRRLSANLPGDIIRFVTTRLMEYRSSEDEDSLREFW